jgi:predicted enzyme related to lactoylglutathione lyase
MDMKLELVPIPVADVDRAKAFYVEQVGFHADHDLHLENGGRIVQLTPPGSACSILLSAGLGDISTMQPGVIKGLHLVVTDIHAACDELAGRGVAVSAITDMGGVFYSYFSDPDTNTWAVQEIRPDAKAQQLHQE